MYIVPIAWLYVALMMSVAEATNTTGTVLGAIVTFILYGLLPTALMVYFMGTPGRNRKRRAQEMAEREAAIAAHAAAAAASAQPDAGGQPPADPVAPVRKEA
ncbi:hypothetical protein [Rhodoferax saidenbachensis]|uniref:Nucleoid-associated protein YgaU n=1 Tax=Rhodoferax saidenbachensis TaxID=1484693 RepID=A0ABU1ZIJ2_9BURK|nr:hypothetical protein [Rhodoferax saidenbachensis]MDR7305359.1 nucleoid-associated protein YgaU [Rhodoferax saidenbachensis]